MQVKFSKRGFIAGVLSTLAYGADAAAVERSLRPRLRPGTLAEAANPVPSDLGRVIEAGKLSGAIGCAVADVATGDILESYGADIPLPPASVVKSLTALYALAHLGPAYRFSTRLVATGPIQNGVLTGDLILIGSGDPSLDTDHLAGLVSELTNTGLRSIKGRFIVDGSALPLAPQIDAEQPPHVAYNPGVSGLNLNYNRVYFGWEKNADGYRIDMEARALRYRPAVKMARMQLKERGSPVYTYRDGGVWDEWTVSRSALSKEGARWLPVRKPDRYVGEIFQSLARAEGLRLPQPEFAKVVTQGVTLVSHESAPLADILQKMLKYSTNLTAETVGMAATKTRLGAAVPLAESAAHMSRWASERYGAPGLSLVDHSGLSDRSRISAEAMVKTLVKARNLTELHGLLKDIKMRNSKGNLVQSAPTGFRAKTGTLNFVAGLGGYVTTAEGRELAFAIFSADTGRRALIPVAQRERPKGASGWNRRAKILQYKILNRWCRQYRS